MRVCYAVRRPARTRHSHLVVAQSRWTRARRETTRARESSAQDRARALNRLQADRLRPLTSGSACGCVAYAAAGSNVGVAATVPEPPGEDV
jgi:hypothetical protein